jgi:hypothetical protein
LALSRTTRTEHDEAAWLINLALGQAPGAGIELGWFTGNWPYFDQNYQQPFPNPTGYVTWDNG